jgi:SAM-dependent methyltransferase
LHPKNLEEEAVICNLCGADDVLLWVWVEESQDPQVAVSMRGHRRFPVVRCRECGLLYLSPRYTAEQLEVLYADEALFKGSADPEGLPRSYMAEEEYKKRAFADVVRWLERYIQGGYLLEVGCGPGFFMQILGSRWTARGIEISPFASGYAQRELGLDVLCGKFAPGIYEPSSFDAIVMLQVLDHLPDPYQALDEAWNLLRDGGILMLTALVNGESYCARTFGGGYRLLAPNHLYYFSPKTLKSLLGKAGFTPLEIRFPYWSTPYCNYREILNLVTRSAQVIYRHMAGRETCVLSPPFYGNHIDIVARKLP